MITLPRLMLAALLAVPVASFAAVPSVDALRANYRYCTTCHGATGNGNAAIQAPSLAGIEGWYLASQLAVYRERHRGKAFTQDPAGTEMRTVAREIGPERVTDIQQYVTAFRAEPQPVSVEGDVAAGRRLYATHCASCHGARAEGNDALQAPGLARLNDWYVVASYRKYVAGLRGSDTAPAPSVAMRAAAAALPADLAIQDIARFLHSLQPRAARSTP